MRRFAQEFRLQGATDKLTWLAGLFYERVSDGFSFFSRIRDYEDTPSFQFWQTYYDVQPGHDGQLVLPFEERPEH